MKMAELKILIDEESLDYEGLFNLLELYSIIDDYLKLKGYDKFERKNEESVYPEGKHIHIIIDPEKWHTDYVRKVLKIEITMRDVKEVETVVDKQKIRINQGKIQMLYTGILQTDWEGRWEQKPIYHFLRIIFEKYVFKGQTKDYEAEIVGDVNELMSKVGSFLNLYRFKRSL